MKIHSILLKTYIEFGNSCSLLSSFILPVVFSAASDYRPLFFVLLSAEVYLTAGDVL